VENPEKASYRWQMMISLFLTNMIFNGIAFNVMPPLFPRISEELKLNYTQIGSLIGAMPLGMLFFSLIGGVCADRFGMKRVVAVSMLAASLLVGARGLAPEFLSLWLCIFFMGVCYGFIIPNLTKGVSGSLLYRLIGPDPVSPGFIHQRNRTSRKDRTRGVMTLSQIHPFRMDARDIFFRKIYFGRYKRQKIKLFDGCYCHNVQG
jgi:hypothetical protein